MSNYLCLLLSTLVKKNYLFDLYTITYSIIGKRLYFWSIRGAKFKKGYTQQYSPFLLQKLLECSDYRSVINRLNTDLALAFSNND
jgi:hypothetical protein